MIERQSEARSNSACDFMLSAKRSSRRHPSGMNSASCGALLSMLSVTRLPCPTCRIIHATAKVPGVLGVAHKCSRADESARRYTFLCFEAWPSLPGGKPYARYLSALWFRNGPKPVSTRKEWPPTAPANTCLISCDPLPQMSARPFSQACIGLSRISVGSSGSVKRRACSATLSQLSERMAVSGCWRLSVKPMVKATMPTVKAETRKTCDTEPAAGGIARTMTLARRAPGLRRAVTARCARTELPGTQKGLRDKRDTRSGRAGDSAIRERS